MNLQSILNDSLAITGLDVAFLLAVTAGLTLLLAVWTHWRANRLVKLSVWVPCLLAMVLSGLGIAEYWWMVSLLTQQEAINPQQAELMFRSAVWGTGRCLAVGAAATCWLHLAWFILGRRRR